MTEGALRCPAAQALPDGGLVDRVPDHVVGLLAAQVRAERLTQVRPRTVKERSANGWFRGTADGRDVFVKLFARAGRGVAERAVAAAVGPVLSTRLLGGGRGADTGEYAVFAWEELAAPVWDTAAAATAGRLLAAVHDTPPPLGAGGAPLLEREPTSASHYARLVARLAAQAPDLFERHRAQLVGPGAVAVVAAAQRAAARAPVVLLHGDFSLRNVARAGRATGTVRDVVFDFERAAVGRAEQDLGRIWDRELAAIPGGRDAFVAAYRAARAVDPGRPVQAALDHARLSCAVSTLIAARRTDDPEFEAEGLAILRALT